MHFYNSDSNHLACKLLKLLKPTPDGLAMPQNTSSIRALISDIITGMISFVHVTLVCPT
jgi:hypothetical protein